MGALQDVDLDVEMKFAHALDDGLAGLRVGRDTERRIFGGELVQRHAHLLLVGLGLGLDRHLDDRIRKLHLLKNDGLGGIAQRIAGAGILEADERDDVAGISLGDFFAVIGVHENHAADALGLLAGRVQQGRRPCRACPNRCGRRSGFRTGHP